MISNAAPARVGILGNPSDGYGGKTLGLAVPDFSATVTLEESDGIEIVPNDEDEHRWQSVDAFLNHVDRFGYGNGPQLLAATIRTFLDVAASIGTRSIDDFKLSYTTNIPRQVGLAGSSALVIATLRCLCEYSGVDLPDHILPSVALKAETAQLGIPAGLQDRVVQTYGGLVAMDFSAEQTDSIYGVSHGIYERVDQASLPPLFLAIREDAAGPSDDYHRELRTRWDVGDSLVRETMRELASLVVDGRAALRWGDKARFVSLIDRNMVLRSSLGPLPPDQLELVEVANRFGASATFAGSGGAVVGAFDDGYSEDGATDHSASDDRAEEHTEQIDSLTKAYEVIGAQLVSINAAPGSEVDNAKPIDDQSAAGDDGPIADVVTLQPRDP